MKLTTSSSLIKVYTGPIYFTPSTSFTPEVISPYQPMKNIISSLPVFLYKSFLATATVITL